MHLSSRKERRSCQLPIIWMHRRRCSKDLYFFFFASFFPFFAEKGYQKWKDEEVHFRLTISFIHIFTVYVYEFVIHWRCYLWHFDIYLIRVPFFLFFSLFSSSSRFVPILCDSTLSAFHIICDITHVWNI